MPAKALKDGKPYIRSVVGGPAFEDARNQGYTVAVVSTFESLENLQYYDAKCESHAALKAVLMTLHQGTMMVFFLNTLPNNRGPFRWVTTTFQVKTAKQTTSHEDAWIAPR